MNKVFLLTGGNMGDRAANLNLATHHIENRIGKIVIKSLVYETAAWGLTDQANFLNQVLEVSTTLEPQQLLEVIETIEKEMGRKRIQKMGPRIIDIDILFYNNDIINQSNLTIPHPAIANRRFVLIPLVEIAPALLHPLLKKTMAELEQACPDPLAVRLLPHLPQ